MANRRGTIPPFMLRRVATFAVLTVVLSLVGTVVLLLLRRSLPVSVHVALILVPVLATLPETYWFVRWSKEIGLRAFENGGRVCWSCGYVLTGLADQGACPECGKGYSLDDLKAKWRTTRLGPMVREEVDMLKGPDGGPQGANGVTKPASATARTPRFLRRRMVAFILAMCIIPTSVLLTTLSGAFGKPGATLPVVIGAQFLFTGAFVAWFVSSHRSLIRRLRAAQNRLCFSCGYDVSTLAPESACPECGEPFDHEDLRKRWLDVNYAPREQWPPRKV